MKPRKPPQSNRQGDLFRVELDRIVDLRHPLIKLSATVQWDRLDALFGQTFCPDNGRPAVSTRLMVALHYLKYTHNLSDENVLLGWVENPYWQYFSGMKWFEHRLPIDPSSMTRWRKRPKSAGLTFARTTTANPGNVCVSKAATPMPAR
jgi:IS5 family transposase